MRKLARVWEWLRELPGVGCLRLHRLLVFGLILLVAWFLAGCGGAESAELASPPGGEPVASQGEGASRSVEQAGASPQEGASPSTDEATPGQGEGSARAAEIPAEPRLDRQGAVEVVVTPLGQGKGAAGALAFEVSMNTHSVDLSMDLAQLATLEADNGAILPALSWTGGSGHHVSGILEFPGVMPDGSPVLKGVRQITLTIRDLDAAQRVFVWQIP